MINPMGLLKAKSSWEEFRKGHPKLVPFVKAVYQGYLKEGTVFDMTVTDADGNAIRCNFRLTAKDMELLKDVTEVLSSD